MAKRTKATQVLSSRSEKDEQAAIIEAAEAMGAKVYVLGTKRKSGDYQGTMQTPGLPDLWIAFDMSVQGWQPIALWWECKRPGGTRTPEQVAFGENCRVCCTPYGWGDLDAFLQWAREHGRAR